MPDLLELHTCDSCGQPTQYELCDPCWIRERAQIIARHLPALIGRLGGPQR